MAKIKISKNIEVTRALPFKPFIELGGFSLGFLSNVRIKEVESGADKKWEFAGYTIPRLEFEFTQFKIDPTDKDRFFNFGINPVTVTKSGGEERESSKIVSSYEEMFKQIKHIHDSFQTSPDYKEFSLEPEFDPDLQIEDRLKEFTAFFKDVLKEFGKGAKTIYISKGGQDKLLAMKLIVKNNSLSFPDFVGRGFIEAANFKDGKLKTDLFYTPSESSNFEEAKATTNVASDAPSMDTAIPQDVLDALNKK